MTDDMLSSISVMDVKVYDGDARKLRKAAYGEVLLTYFAFT